jgi:hypothetical protein
MKEKHMKLGSIIFTILFVFMVSYVYAEDYTWKCKNWEKIETKSESGVKATPVKKKVIKPIPQKIADIKPVNCFEKSKKNTIFLEPMIYFMWSNEARRLVTAPGLGISYVRDLTPTFSLGGGFSYAHAFYGKFPTRTFNMYGGKLMLGFKF